MTQRHSLCSSMIAHATRVAIPSPCTRSVAVSRWTATRRTGETCVTTIGVSNALWAYLQQHAQISDETPTAIIERLLGIALPQPQTLSVSVIVRADR